MAVTEAQRRAHDKYFSKAYKQIKLSMPNEEAEALEVHCAEYGYTKAGFIRQSIKEKIERDNAHSNASERATSAANSEGQSDTRRINQAVTDAPSGLEDDDGAPLKRV